MNTYDFDKTIFRTDSSALFYRYCIRKRPLAILKAAPASLGKAVLYALHRIETKELKQQLFSFLRDVEDIDSLVAQFWQENANRLEDWYLAQKKDDDLIISASPEFLLRPITERLGVKLIGTVMDKKTGLIQGENCHDWAKVDRFYALYPDGVTEEFYSDSLTDSPMAAIADRAFLVTRGSRSPWPESSLESCRNSLAQKCPDSLQNRCRAR